MGVMPEQPVLGIDNSIFFSYPCKIDENGEIQIVEDFKHGLSTTSKIKASEEQLLEEKEMVFPGIKENYFDDFFEDQLENST